MTLAESRQDVKLIAHLLRRASFGATPWELVRAMRAGYHPHHNPHPLLISP